MFRKSRSYSGGGNALTAFLVMSLTLSMAVGCNGASDPISFDGSGGIFRTGQSINAPSQWGVGYSLDSGSTISVYPCESTVCGDIAYNDRIGDGDTFSTFVTAVVRHDNYEAKSEIHLILLDEEEVNVFEDTFSADAMSPSDPFARHPAVEVTYERAPEGEVGTLRVHVIWSELTEAYPENDFWALYYRMLAWDVDENDDGIDWYNPDTDETVKLPWDEPDTDQIEPDLCVLTAFNDLFVVFLQQAPTFNDVIRAARHEYADIDDLDAWDSPEQVNESNSNAKWCANIDAGQIRNNELHPGSYGDVVAVWCENTSTVNSDIYNVFYNDWEPLSTPDPYSTQQISFSGEGEYTSNLLPQLSIPSHSSQVHEAMITWWTTTYDSQTEEWGNYWVAITATPYMGNYQSMPGASGWSRCSDVAAYQMNDEEHQFAVSYYSYNEDDQDWDIYVRRIGLEMNYQSSTFTFTSKGVEWNEDADCYWTGVNPFTGSTVCLRIPDETVGDSYLGLGWIDTSSYYAELTDCQVQ